MYYMLAFNKKESLIMYWDEPTITLDYEGHPCHPMIKTIWSENKIPNIVLSSATLPQKEEIVTTIMDFKTRFEGEDYSIVSYDCKKTISIINRDGYTELPHYLYNEYDEVKNVVKHCKKYKTLLRYFDLREIIRFIKYINDKNYIKHRLYSIEYYFKDISMITMLNIKLYYLEVLTHLKNNSWNEIHAYLNDTRRKGLDSSIYITTKDAHTLTDVVPQFTWRMMLTRYLSFVFKRQTFQITH